MACASVSIILKVVPLSLLCSLQGITLRLMGEKLVIARIMYGGLIHRQGLLKVGDVVKEVNGEVVSSMQPVELQSMLVRELGGQYNIELLLSLIHI